MKKVIYLAFIFSLFNGCNQKTDRPEEVSKDQTKADTMKDIFPHSATFMKTQLHGAYYKKDKALCKSCHMQKINEGEEHKAEFCLNCHITYPHSSEFKTTYLHGGMFLKSPSSCTKCHNTGPKEKDSGQHSCKSCHNYPHSSGWVSFHHGENFLKNKNCNSCHDENSKFKERNPEHFVSCKKCHIGVPHEFDVSGHMDGEAVPKTMTACTQCHTPHGKYHKKGHPDMDCKMCHDVSAHRIKKPEDLKKLKEFLKPKRSTANKK